MSKEYKEAKSMAYDIKVGNNLFQTRTGYNFIQQQYNDATKFRRTKLVKALELIFPNKYS